MVRTRHQHTHGQEPWTSKLWLVYPFDCTPVNNHNQSIGECDEHVFLNQTKNLYLANSILYWWRKMAVLSSVCFEELLASISTVGFQTLGNKHQQHLPTPLALPCSWRVLAGYLVTCSTFLCLSSVLWTNFCFRTFACWLAPDSPMRFRPLDQILELEVMDLLASLCRVRPMMNHCTELYKSKI